MKINELIEVVGKRWSILEKLYEKDYYVTELAKTLTKKTPEISKQLNELRVGELVGFTQKPSERRKTYSLTDTGRKAVELVRCLERPEPRHVELTDPDPRFWKDLKLKLSSKREWAAKAALNDLKKLCRERHVWKLGDDFWHYLNAQLSMDENPNLNKILDCINSIAWNASTTKENDVVDHIKDLFCKRLAEMLGSERFENEWSTTFACLKSILSEDEMLNFIEKKYEEAFKLEHKEYGHLSTLLIDELKSLYKTHANDVREWLYEQMENLDVKVAENAYFLYQSLC